jgi:hypothetical protein
MLIEFATSPRRKQGLAKPSSIHEQKDHVRPFVVTAFMRSASGATA